jgi:hypothetical protein
MRTQASRLSDLDLPPMPELNTPSEGAGTGSIRLSDLGIVPLPDLKPEAGYDPTEGMGTGERFLVGLGRGMLAPAQAVKQMGLHAFADDATAREYDRQLAEENRLYAPLERQGGAATVGELAGNVAATLPLLAVPGGQSAGLAGRLGGYGLAGAASGALQPGSGEGDFATEKLQQAGTGAALGAGVGGGLSLAAKAVEKALPSNLVLDIANRTTDKALQTPFGQEGQRLVKETGIELTPGAVSGSKPRLFAENLARQSVFTMEKAAAVDKKIADQAIRRINQIMDGLAGTSESAETVGSRVMEAVKRGAIAIDRQRDAAAASDYGQVRALAGHRRIFSYGNTATELQKIIAEHENVVGSDAEKIVTQAKAALDKLSRTEPAGTGGADGLPLGTPVLGTLDEAMKSRRFWSRASRGSGNVFADVEPSINRQLAARLVRAIDDDFEAAGDLPGEIGQALKQANATYRKYSQSLDYLGKSPLGRLLGRDLVDAAFSGQAVNTTAAEKFADRFIRMTPSEVKISRQLLEQHAPDALRSVRRYVLERALQSGREITSSTGATGPGLSGFKFIRALLPEASMQALYTRRELFDINQVVKALARWGDRTGYNASGTAPATEFLSLVNSLVSLSTRATAAAGSKALGLRQIAEAMNHPDGRAHLLTLLGNPPVDQAIQAAAYLANRFPGDRSDSAPGWPPEEARPGSATEPSRAVGKYREWLQHRWVNPAGETQPAPGEGGADSKPAADWSRYWKTGAVPARDEARPDPVPNVLHAYGLPEMARHGVDDSVISPEGPETRIKNLYDGPLPPDLIEEQGGADPYQVDPKWLQL